MGFANVRGFLVPLVFEKSDGIHMAGDLAGFSVAEARAFIKRGIAHLDVTKPPPSQEQLDALTPSELEAFKSLVDEAKPKPPPAPAAESAPPAPAAPAPAVTEAAPPPAPAAPTEPPSVPAPAPESPAKG